MFLSGASGLLTVGLCIRKARIPSFELDLGLCTDSLPFESDCCVRRFIVKWGVPRPAHGRSHSEDLSGRWTAPGESGLAASIIVREYSKKWITDFPSIEESGMF